MDVVLCVLLHSTVGGGEWSASSPGRFTPGERAPGAHIIGGWVGHTVSLEAVAMRNNSLSCWEYNPGRPPRSSVTKLTELTW